MPKKRAPYGDLVMVPSKSMKRELPILVFLPSNYKRTRRRFPVVYKLHGRCGQAELMNERGLREMHGPGVGMLEMADLFHVIIVAPIVGNTFYLDSPLRREVRMSTYVGRELPAFIDAHYRTEAAREGRILAGFSMGGYGAVSTLCRYPRTFSLALSRSGVMDLAFGPKDLGWDNAAAEDMLGSYAENKEAFEANSCFTLVEKIRRRRNTAVVIETGMNEFLVKNNRDFHQKLLDIEFPHVYAEYPCEHTWGRYPLLSLLTHMQQFRETLF